MRAKNSREKGRIHFIGIGGIGMSAIARVLLETGHKVSGSDLEQNNLTKKIESLGGKIFEGHAASNLPEDAGTVVYSSSISGKNPELKEALRRKLKVIHRAGMLGELFNKKKGIGVTGTHGKTTTTSLVSVMLQNTGLDPTVIIGGEVGQFGGNAKAGSGEYLVAEADESDSSFLKLRPYYAVVTNIEMEHVDHFRTLSSAIRAYRSFVRNIKRGGMVFYNHDDANARQAVKESGKRYETFGFSKDADIYAADIRMNRFETSFKCFYKSNPLGEVKLMIPGRHNILNALAAILVGLKIGLKFGDIADSIKDFTGTKRRFQLRIEEGGAMLIDDYAHHPTEIRAVLDACRNWRDRRIVAVFQPHRYTRTKFLADEFGRCFEGVGKLILTDIYAASEKPIKGVSLRNIYDKAKANGIKDIEIVKKEKIADRIMAIKRPGDMILVLGAGDIKKVADELYDRMKSRSIDNIFTGEFQKAAMGNMRFKERLDRHTSFRIGGTADIWTEPKDTGELKKVLLFAGNKTIPLFVIGNGSNVLASDNGFRGIILHLGAPAFKELKIKGDTLRVGAGFSLPKLVKICCDKGLGGLESLVGIPGTIGGAIFMNAGGSANPIYKNIGDLVRSLKVMDYNGRIKSLKRDDIAFGYRESNLSRYIILEATLKLEKSDRALVSSSCVRFLRMKAEKQVLDMPSAGCVFKNPPASQFTCGQMIDMLGLKGKRIGGAEISAKHANFIVNRNNATCSDVLALADLIKNKVRENYNVPLEMEIKVI